MVGLSLHSCVRQGELTGLHDLADERRKVLPLAAYRINVIEQRVQENSQSEAMVTSLFRVAGQGSGHAVELEDCGHRDAEVPDRGRPGDLSGPESSVDDVLVPREQQHADR